MKKVFFALAIAGLLIPRAIIAGGGRFEFSGSEGKVLPGGIEVTVRIHKEAEGEISPFEKAELRVENPRSGDRCDTTGGATDVNGYLRGGCYATEPGTVKIYVHSNDRGDNSGFHTLTFNANPTSAPSPTSSISPTSKFLKISPTPEEEETPTPEPTEEITPSPTPQASGGLANNRPFMGLLLIVIIIAIGGGIYYWKQKKTTIRKISTEHEREPEPRTFE